MATDDDLALNRTSSFFTPQRSTLQDRGLWMVCQCDSLGGLALLGGGGEQAGSQQM